MIRQIIHNINIKKLKKNLKVSLILFVILLILSGAGLTFALYESDSTLNLTPSIAFFIVDATSESKTIELTRMVPSNDYYDYYFEVSNFNDSKKADVDLNYTIKLKMTTNLPLDYQIYRIDNGAMANINNINIITNKDGMYFKEYIDSGSYFMSYKNKTTDRYLLRVTFPMEYKNDPDYYESVIDLVEVIIDATQVV